MQRIIEKYHWLICMLEYVLTNYKNNINYIKRWNGTYMRFLFDEFTFRNV